jgi:hypothetical protein
MVEILPVEIITKILQLACQDIVNTLDGVVRQKPRIKYHVSLARFSKLLRVCWLFNNILNKSIHINGIPIRQKLIGHQLARVTSYIDVLQQQKERESDSPSPMDIYDLKFICGPCWANPRFNEIASFLFEEIILDDALATWLYFLTPGIWLEHIEEHNMDDRETALFYPSNMRLMIESGGSYVWFKIGKHIFNPRTPTWGDFVGFSVDNFDLDGFWSNQPRSTSRRKSSPIERYWIWCKGCPELRRLHDVRLQRFFVVDYELREIFDSDHGEWARASEDGLQSFYHGTESGDE